MFHAYQSQSIATVNSNITITYNNICKIVLQHIHTNIQNLPTQSSKSSRKSLGKKLETSLKCKYISYVFLNKLSEVANDPGSKLSTVYGRIKTKLEYENDLDHNQFKTLTKIRLSSHWFPIEAGRYTKPINPREQRITFDRISRHFRAMRNLFFDFFLNDRRRPFFIPILPKSIGTSLYSICQWLHQI